MTCLERFWNEHPNFTIFGKCPHEYGYLPNKSWDCNDIDCYDECWLRQAIDKVDMKENNRFVSDLISRERALKALEEANVHIKNKLLRKFILAKYSSHLRERYIDAIEKIPPVDIELVHMGEWIDAGKTEKGSPIRRCSYYGVEKAGRPRTNYCPDCGAKMIHFF